MPADSYTERKERFSISAVWTPELAKTRYVPVVRAFLRGYSKLRPPISPQEAIFIIHVMDYKWDENLPWPSYSRLASNMGVSIKTVRRCASSLQAKGYLVRVHRGGSSNRFDFAPLFQTLERAMLENPESEGRTDTPSRFGGTFLSIWLQVESSLRAAAQRNKIAAAAPRSPAVVVRDLVLAGTLDRSTLEEFDRLRSVRNRFVHGRSTAEDYQLLSQFEQRASELIGKLSAI